MRGQAVAIALVVMCGVATHVMFLSTLNALRETQQGYYREYRFADVFVSLKRAPEACASASPRCPGWRGRTPGGGPAAGRHAGFRRAGECADGLAAGARRAQRPASARGAPAGPERADEVVVSTPFAEAHGLHPGGRFHVILNGRRQALTVAGTALSPEFIQQMRPGSAFPDSKRYGVMWMERRALGQAYDLEGAFNDLAIGLAPGASAAAVMAAVDGCWSATAASAPTRATTSAPTVS
jgi:putative ABC transport system permease protein